MFTSIWMEATAGGGQQANPVLAFMPLILMLGIFYFLLIRPQQRKQKQQGEMLKGLKKGDRVVTNGGLIGTVVGIKDEEIVLRVGDGETKIEFLKSSVTSVMSKSA